MSPKLREGLALLAFAAAVGLVIGFAIGPFGGGGQGSITPVSVTSPPPAMTTPGASAPVSIEFVTKKLVWVCLLDQRGNPVIDGLNLLTDQTVGPYGARAFVVTFGNGSVDLAVNGEQVDVPPIAAPLGYRITPRGATRLARSDQPTCT